MPSAMSQQIELEFDTACAFCAGGIGPTPEATGLGDLYFHPGCASGKQRQGLTLGFLVDASGEFLAHILREQNPMSVSSWQDSDDCVGSGKLSDLTRRRAHSTGGRPIGGANERARPSEKRPIDPTR
jgi:hypothetical protein